MPEAALRWMAFLQVLLALLEERCGPWLHGNLDTIRAEVSEIFVIGGRPDSGQIRLAVRGFRPYRRACPSANGSSPISRESSDRSLAPPLCPASMSGSLKSSGAAIAAIRSPPHVWDRSSKYFRRRHLVSDAARL